MAQVNNNRKQEKTYEADCVLNLTEAVYDRMANDPTISDALVEFEGEPAIFVEMPLPRGFNFQQDWPFIITEGNSTDDTDGSSACKNADGRMILRDVRIYQHVDGLVGDLEDLSERVYEVFHRAKLDIDGWTTVSTTASGPILGPTDDEKIRARIVTLEINLHRSD